MYYMKHNQLTKLYPATHGRCSSGDFINALNHLFTAVSGVGSSITSDACETSQSLLAGVSDVFSRDYPVFFFFFFLFFFNVREIKLKQTLYILYKQ